MPARRISSSSLPPPSSPPSAFRQDGEVNGPSEARGVPSPAQTLWTAHPSPTQTLGHSSPELPPLPGFSTLGSAERTPSTVARHEDTSSYYTASWGSPYRHPPPSFNRGRNLSANSGSDDLEEDASNLQFGLEHLLPRLPEDDAPNPAFGLEHLLPPRLTEDNSPNRFNLEHLIPSRLPPSFADTPTKSHFPSDNTPRSVPFSLPASETVDNPSEKWVQQFLDGGWNHEARNWQSDGSTDGDDQRLLVEKPQKKKGHKSRANNLTLTPQDFWSHIGKTQQEELGKMMASRYADPQAHSRQGSGASLRSQLSRSMHADKPLPTPEEEKAPESPKFVVDAQGKPQTPTKAVSPAPTPRQRKRIPVKGKSCWISIPTDIPRGSPGFPPKPMSPAEVESKLQHLQRAGYDTRGFGYWKGADVSSGLCLPQNRAIWPDEGEVRAERSGQYRVRIPNKSDWDAYVNHLLEAKLAALGVSVGGEEDDNSMSRQTSASQHPSMPFSPPLPTSSAGSHRIRQGSIVSGSFPLGPSPGHASRQSMASPITAFGNQRPSMHMHRHSTFGSPASFIQHQAASPSGQWSPNQYFGVQGPRGGSPALPPLPPSRPDPADLASPNSPFGFRSGQQFPPAPTQRDEVLAQMQQQQHQHNLQAQQQQQLFNLRPSSTLAEVPEDEAEEDEMPELKNAAKSGPEIAVPTPRGHRHNISASLEREAREAEYHLEEAIDKQFEEGGDFSTEPENNTQFKHSAPVADSTWEESRPVLHQPQPHSRAHSLTKPQQSSFSFGFGPQQPENPRADVSDGARTNISDVTNPSLGDGNRLDAANGSAQHSKTASQVSSSWKDTKLAFGKPGSAMHSKHTSRSSISRLNVEAKEFNPSTTFSPNSFSSSCSFSPGIKPFGQDEATRSNRVSIDGLSSLNVAAPVFKPDAPVFKPDVPAFKPASENPTLKAAVEAPVFKPGLMNGSALPSSIFSFISEGSVPKPDAPVFTPTSGASMGQSPTAPTNFSSKIFGNVSISATDIVKPAKRSKAIPIVRPDATRQKTPEEEEDKDDEFGRIMQADGREKRARHVHDGGDDVPQFALPSQPLAESKQPQAAKQDPQIERETAPEDKENLSPNAERPKSKSKSPDPLVTIGLNSSFEPSIPTPQTEMSTGSLSDSKTPIDDRTPQESDAPTPTVDEAPKPFTNKHAHKTSSLSAAAKPFEFRPQFGTSGFDFGYHVTKPSVAQDDEHNNTHISPPRHSSRSPATTFRPSDDGSFKTALESRRHVPYAESESLDFDNFGQTSFNDIDAVIQHMNEEGSDFGIERDDPTWEQSSPRRSPHQFERHDLAPNVNLRSDAPSPSPRRLYAPRNLNASSTSITHDPFSDDRAGLAYESPVHRLNNAAEVPMSDWDEGLTSEGEDKIQTRSRFFDSHVDTLISRLLQSRLGPMEKNLQGIQDAIVTMSQRPGRGRRSMSTNGRLDSDADDEDDEIGTDSHFRTRSPRKDRRLEKIRSIVKEALESHQPAVTSLPVPVPAVVEPMKPDNVREIIMEALAHHQPQWTPPKFEPVPAEQIRAIVEEAVVSHQPTAPDPVVEPIKPDDIRSIVLDALASHAPTASESTSEPVKSEEIRSIVMDALATHAPQLAVEPIRPDDVRAIVTAALTEHAPQLTSTSAVEPVQPDLIRSIVMEAFAMHAPQSAPSPVPEQLRPDDIRSIVTEALAAQQPQLPPAPAGGPIEPDTIRSIVAEALASHKPAATLEPPVDIPQPQVDMSEIFQVIGSLKASIAHATSSHIQAEDIREVIEDALKRQSEEAAEREEARAIEEKDIRIADLEAMLKETSLRLDTEAEARKVLEAREVDGARLLEVTEKELALLREAAGDDENKIRALQVECEDTRGKLDSLHNSDEELRNRLVALQTENDELKLKAIAFESSEDDIKKKLDVVSAENEALSYTLEEHRMSTNKWRNDIQAANEENERMRKTINSSRLQHEEAIRLRESMRTKFEKLQQDMIIASGQAAAERAQWQKSDEAHMKKYEVLSARIEAEGRTRERLERELERLETQEREGMKLKVALEQTQKANVRLEQTLDELRQESVEHQRTAERYEREFREAREAGRVEVRRTRVLMEADIDAANNQVNIVRADLESEISRIRAELDQVRMDTDTVKAKHEVEMEAASDAKKHAVKEAFESKTLALQEQHQVFERRFERLSQEHCRALEIAREDKERAETFHKDRISLAESKMEHLQDKVALLEEKLAVTKEAASAAAAAAQSVKFPAIVGPSLYGSGLPEKISPQALRESIAVLQEQLQERESRIESLEHKLAEVDTEAPAKLKERDTEIGWLRELLGVRIDDLNDLVNSLAQPTFDREMVRDAAIRIRTNLQMEQQEKERLVAGGQSFPTLATLSNFASPKAVQLAAAIGNWRKGRDNGSSSLVGGSNNTSRNQTPSRIAPPAAQSFLSGLMTPPTSNLRRTPDLPSSAIRPQNIRSNSSSSRGSAGFPSLGKQPVPSTPPLLHKAAYDQDAEDGHFSESGFYDDESTVDGDMTPIGLNFGQELRR
ncbi:uncharacterized protein BDR25DRAFT_302954 [Lindgomyces ingoldianus]|uniref:Uncharacterized protein n=1 Tax=Lindgomyces ingoldianus TaxID=673940 RepID=A0ACB6QZ58_9PLEO|nr:uncharacterized protein BDR25DRAFT_302954 [Lindgomyces ingoldianus]KAF2472201.1 hypothetical protein BDR25DRAFT_302954 [Lindgomyces ingoldianus]